MRRLKLNALVDQAATFVPETNIRPVSAPTASGGPPERAPRRCLRPQVIYELIPVNQRKVMHEQLAGVLEADLRRHMLLGQWGTVTDPFEANHMENIGEHYLMASGELQHKGLSCAFPARQPRTRALAPAGWRRAGLGLWPICSAAPRVKEMGWWKELAQPTRGGKLIGHASASGARHRGD